MKEEAEKLQSQKQMISKIKRVLVFKGSRYCFQQNYNYLKNKVTNITKWKLPKNTLSEITSYKIFCSKHSL